MPQVRTAARAPGRGALHVAAFMTDRAQLASNAERYVNAWASATTKEAAEQVSGACAMRKTARMVVSFVGISAGQLCCAIDTEGSGGWHKHNNA